LIQLTRPCHADENISRAPTNDKKEHKDFVWKPKNSKTSIEFYWRANVITATNLIDEWLEKEQAPDMLVLDPSAHQAKWARNFTEFKGEIPGLMESLKKYHQKVRICMKQWTAHSIPLWNVRFYLC
jgi:hypothetical protein